MSVWMFLKVLSDLFLIFAILGPFPELIVYHSSLLIPAILCAFGAAIAAGLQNSCRGHLRWLGAAFPALALYLAWVNGEFVIVLAAAVYTVAVILWGRLNLEYYSFCHSFQTSLKIAGLWYLLLWACALLKETPVKDFSLIHEEIALRYGLLHCFTGILVQRQLRLGGDTVAKGSRLQTAAMLVGTGSVLAAFIGVMPVLRQAGAKAVKAVVIAFAGLLSLSADSFQWDYAGMREKREESMANSDAIHVEPNWAEIIPQQPQAADKEPSYWWIILVVVFAIAAAVLLLRSFSKGRISISAEEIRGKIDAPERSREPRRSNRAKVRHYYREYLRYEQKRGLAIKKYHTSGDVLQKSAVGSDKTAAAALRQIYLRARYDESGEITRDQAEAAKDLLKKIRGGANTV